MTGFYAHAGAALAQGANTPAPNTSSAGLLAVAGGFLTGHWVDLLIVAVAAWALWVGYRQGAIATVLSTVGVAAGFLCGAALAPMLMSYTDATALRFLLAIGIIVLLAGVGNMVGGLLGQRLRENLKFRRSLRVDSAFGALFQTAVTLFLAWLVALPLASTPINPFASSIAQSRILGFIDKHSPVAVADLTQDISAMLSESGLPPLMSPFQDLQAREVAAPPVAVSDQALVDRVRPSVIHVVANSTECRRRLMGSGFVFAPDLVITNAHVVAGTDTVSLDTTTGMHDATVVLYDPEEDIAILRSENLGIPPLNWAENIAHTGDEAIVMGFPASGPFVAAPARVRELATINAPDIYGTNRVDRSVYLIRSSVRQGNSGGPMIDLEGNVLGVVFGTAVDASDTGYVISAREVRQKIGDATALIAPVSTQACAVK